MRLSDVKAVLPTISKLRFQLPDESFVPEHFHVTEIGVITKHFIDCGGTIRTENKINFQLWEDEKDIEHELKPSKLLDIIQLSEKVLGIDDAEIEVEYQEYTIGKYELEFDGSKFLLQNTRTDCLAREKCGVPEENAIEGLREFGGEEPNACVPGTCC